MATLNREQIVALFREYKNRLLRLYKKRSVDEMGIIGLDIGAESLKMLVIDTSMHPPRIKHFGILPLPADSIVKDSIKNVDAVCKGLIELVAQSGLKIKNIAFSIPRSLAIIKTILISSELTEEEIESRAWIEAERHFPDLIGDVYLDYVTVKNEIAGRRFDDPKQRELILVAGRKEQIKPYLQIIEKAGLITQLVDVNCYALERALLLMDDKIKSYSTVALLNLNTNLSSLIVMHEGKMIHAHDETFDGQHLLREIREYLHEKSSTGYQNFESPIEDELYNAILRNNLISHLRHTVQFIYSSHPDINIELIVLAGDCAQIPGLAAFTQNEIGTPSLIANPFTEMQCEQGVDQIELHENAPGLMLCAGLAVSVIERVDDSF